MKCPECQHENLENSRFCAKCATPLVTEKIPELRTKTLRVPSKETTSGTIIAGKYKIIEELGTGGMGKVYKAEDVKLKRTVALKFLSLELTQELKARERFIHEAQAASGLDHPNICTIHEIGETEDGQMFIAMAYCKGESLKEKIQGGPLKPEEIVDIALQAAQGLAKAHENGIVHRDVKPANIMTTQEGLAKIVDFGLAKLAGTTRITQVGTTMGTVAYMSPEQARGEEVDQRTDVWSLGVVLYEMLSGQMPFKGEQEQAVVYSILKEEPAPIKAMPSGVPRELGQIIHKALSKDPAKRYASGKELAEALQALKSKMAVGVTPITRKFVFARPQKRMLIAGAVSVAVLAAIMLTWVLTRPSLAFQERDRLLVADVDNLTGDSVFDLALRTAIEADLQQSPYANIFDKAQMADTLRLMRKAPTTKVDEELGCDICRFSGVRALILPRILSAGEAYELQAILIDPVKRRHVDRIRVTARGREEVLLHAIDKLAIQVRSRLGESIESIAKADEPVIKVTTSSWEALKYLSMGMVKWNEMKFAEAAPLFELALEKDPHFVSARGSLGLLLIQFLGQKEKGKEMLKLALEDAEAQSLPQIERLRIKAASLQFVDEDFEGALEEYRLMREIDPDFMPAYNNAGMILRGLGRYDEAMTMYQKAAEVAPRSSIPLANLWYTYIFFTHDARAAEEVGRKLVNLGPEIAGYLNFLAYSLAIQARFDEAFELLRKTVALEPQHPYGLPNLAHTLLASDRAAEAVPVYREVRELARQRRVTGTFVKCCFDLAFALAEAGEKEAAKEIAAEGREYLQKELGSASPSPQNLIILGQLEAVSGKTSEARQYLSKALNLGAKDPYTLQNLSELYALLEDKAQAIETLKKALESGFPDYFFPVILPAYQSIRNDPQFRALFNLDAIEKQPE